MIVNSCLNVRAAAPEDVPEIHALLEPYADAKIVLRRSQEDILQYIGNFVVAEIDGKICGCGAARDFGGSLYEVRSLVVNKSIQKKGIGSRAIQLAEAIVKEYSESLYIEVAARNRNAIRLYQRIGYNCLNTITIRKDFRPETCETVSRENITGAEFEIKQYKG